MLGSPEYLALLSHKMYNEIMASEKASSADNQQERLPKKMRELKYYLAGFVDGEGCFSVSIKPRSDARLGWVVDPMFQVYQHRDNRFILELFKRVLNCGYIVEKDSKKTVLVYVVDRMRDLKEKILPFFERYRLITSKYEDFLKFREVILRMSRKEHLTREGLRKIVAIACRMNKHGRERKYREEDILASLEESSETIRQPVK